MYSKRNNKSVSTLNCDARRLFSLPSYSIICKYTSTSKPFKALHSHLLCTKFYDRNCIGCRINNYFECTYNFGERTRANTRVSVTAKLYAEGGLVTSCMIYSKITLSTLIIHSGSVSTLVAIQKSRIALAFW